MIFILSSNSSGFEFWSVNHTWICGNSESNVLKNINFSGETFNNWPNDLLGTNVYKALKFGDNESTTWKSINTTSVISKRGTFSPFLFFYLNFSASK